MAFSLIPKNDAYFTDFEEAIVLARDMANTLAHATSQVTLPENLWTQLKTTEVKADEIVRRCLARMDQSFVTPIEREDIHLLIMSIDDVCDTLAAIGSRLDVYGIQQPTQEMRAIAQALVSMLEQLVVAVTALRTLKPVDVREAIARVAEIERRVDDLFREALRALFRRQPEAYELVRWHDIYDMLEATADHGRQVARVVGHILVRHS